MICILCIAVILSFMNSISHQTRETEGFNNIKGINSIGLDKESFLEVVEYNSTSNASQRDRRNMSNFKLRKRLTSEGKDVWSVFYLKLVTINTPSVTTKDVHHLCCQDIENGSSEKWLKFNGEIVLYEFDGKIQYYEYIDSGSLKDNIIYNYGVNIYLLQPNITTSPTGAVSKTYGEQITININVDETTFKRIVLVILNIVVIPENNGYSFYIKGTYIVTTNNFRKSVDTYIVKLNITKSNILTNSKLSKNNIKDEIKTFDSFITDVTIDNERKILLIYKEGDKFSISISKDLIVNQFKRTEDYNTLESLMMGGNIIGITSFKNSVYIVGYFDNKYSEHTEVSGQVGDNKNRMEMIKINIMGDEIRVDSIVSLPPEFTGDSAVQSTGNSLNNLLVLDNQIMFHYKDKLITMSDGSKDPNFITKPRRAKTNIDSVYKTSDSFTINNIIKWPTGTTSMNPVSLTFTLKNEDIKDSDTILIYGISLKHKDVSNTNPPITNHLIKRFMLDNTSSNTSIDGGSSFGFYINDNTLKTENKHNPFYFMFVTPFQLSLTKPTTTIPPTKTTVQLNIKIFDVGGLGVSDLGGSVLKNGVAENDLNMVMENITIYYNTFEKGEIDGSGVNMGDDRCQALEKKLEEIKNADVTNLTSSQIKDISTSCKEEYDEIIPPGMDLNALTKEQIEDMIPRLEQVHLKCKSMAMKLEEKGDESIATNIIKDIDLNTELKDTVTELDTAIDTLNTNKQKEAKSSYFKGLKDSVTFVLEMIVNNFKDQDNTIHDKSSIKNIRDEIKKINDDVTNSENALTCDGSEYNLKINDLIDNIKLYKTYNDIKVKKFANLYPTPIPK